MTTGYLWKVFLAEWYVILNKLYISPEASFSFVELNMASALTKVYVCKAQCLNIRSRYAVCTMVYTT